jgi:hypothetical protein
MVLGVGVLVEGGRMSVLVYGRNWTLGLVKRPRGGDKRPDLPTLSTVEGEKDMRSKTKWCSWSGS